jgi:phage/plasmid-like protein (TIGR03299 family)
MAPGIMLDKSGIAAKAAFIAADKPGWHNLGVTVVKGAYTCAAALVKIAANFPIEMRPMFVSVSVDNPLDANQAAIVPDKYMLYRGPCALSDNPAFYGVVGKDYEFFQNHEIADLIDSVREATGWELETMGALWDGATLFIALDGGLHTVAGEDVRMYFLYVSNRNGKDADYILATPVRVVCNNTLQISLNKNFGRVNIRHLRGMKDLTSYAMSIVTAAHQAGNDMISALRRLESIVVDADGITRMLDVLFPLLPTPDLTFEINSGNETVKRKAESKLYRIKRANEINERARDLIQSNYDRLGEEIPTDNAWRAFQAVTAFVTHQNSKSTPNGAWVRAKKDIFGEGERIRTLAYEFLTA